MLTSSFMSVTQLTPTQLFRFAFMSITSALQKSTEEEREEFKITPFIFTPNTSYQCYGAQFNRGDYSVFLLNPACDLNEHVPSVSAGTTLLSQSLNWIKELQKKKGRKTSIFIIPLAECSISFFTRRQHWTFLIVEEKQCHLCDPKGQYSSSYFYSLQPISNAISEAGYTLTESYYANWQAVTDNTSCGYFTGYFIQQTVSHHHQYQKINSIKEIIGDAKPESFVVRKYHDSLLQNNKCYEELRIFAEMGTKPNEVASWGKDLSEEEESFLEKDIKPILLPVKQLERDYKLITAAIKNPGEYKFSGEILKKIYALLYVGNFYYLKNNEWKKWDIAPIVAALCHGARIIIQLDTKLDDKVFLYWLFPRREHTKLQRFAATHGLAPVEHIILNPSDSPTPPKAIVKKMKEEKLSVPTAAGQSIYNAAASKEKYKPQHYGVDLALGGAGSKHEKTRKIITSNGEHGHLYLHCRPSTNKDEPTAWLVGIEQSAPLKSDQQGGSHSIFATRSDLSATDGTYFGKGEWKEEKGVPDVYYNSMILIVTEQTIDLAKILYEKPDLNWLNKPSLTREEREKLLPPQKPFPARQEQQQATTRPKKKKGGQTSLNQTPKAQQENRNQTEITLDKKLEPQTLLSEENSQTPEPKTDAPLILSDQTLKNQQEENPQTQSTPDALPNLPANEFSLSSDPTQKNSQNNTALICFSIGIIGSCIIIGAVWYTGAAFIIGFSIINASCLIPITAIMGGIYYWYQARQFIEMMATENVLEQSLKTLNNSSSIDTNKISVQHLQNLAVEIHNLNISAKIKKQLYNEFQNEIQDAKTPLSAEKICQKLIDAENKNHLSYCGLFGRKSHSIVTTTLEKYKKKINSSPS